MKNALTYTFAAAALVLAGFTFAPQLLSDPKIAACREVSQAAATSAQRLTFTGRMSDSDRALFTEVVTGYAIAMQRSPTFAAITIEHALADRGAARRFNREVWFASDRDEYEAGIAYGEWSLTHKEAWSVLEMMKRRFSVYTETCKGV